MPPVRVLLAVLLAAGFTACASAPVLAPVAVGWRSVEGPEEEILFRRVASEFDADGGAVVTTTSERRVLRRARRVSIRVAIDPDRSVLSAEARMIDERGTVHRFARDQFVWLDRRERLLTSRRGAAFLAINLPVPGHSLVDWMVQTRDRNPHWLPELDLSSPYPIQEARLSARGRGIAAVQATPHHLDATSERSGDVLYVSARNLPPSTGHPWAPGELGRRRISLHWRTPEHPDLVARLLGAAGDDYALATLPGLRASAGARPCLLFDHGVHSLRPGRVFLTTATAAPNGGWTLDLPAGLARRFAGCRLIERGAPAIVPVRTERGQRVLLMRSTVESNGRLSGRGQLLFAGAAADAVRQGSVDPEERLRDLLRDGPIKPFALRRQIGADGPVRLSFKIAAKVKALDPSAWIGDPLRELAWTGAAGQLLGPASDERRVEWTFEWPEGAPAVPPANGSGTFTTSGVSGSATWSLGPQRVLRFVRAVNWSPGVRPVAPDEIQRLVRRLVLPSAALP
jgi:hypothetical protein